MDVGEGIAGETAVKLMDKEIQISQSNMINYY
jgi:hypothetical protein